MSRSAERMSSEPHRPLEGLKAWLITDAKMGSDVQAKGVAEALGLAYEVKHVAPKGVFRLMAPYGPVPPAERFGTEGSAFAPPWPAIAIAVGRTAIPYLKALKRRAGLSVYTIVLLDPRTSNRAADLFCVPAHDRKRGPNVITTLTPAHPYSQHRLAKLREVLPADIAALPSPRVAVILGGTNAVYRFTEASLASLARSLADMARLGASFMITPSRRTQPELLKAVDEATRDAPRILFSGGENPYPSFLAHADAFVVTADSVNMCGEACATGKPIYVFRPEGGSDKFDRYHAGLGKHGATRPLPARVDRIESWTYPPLDATAEIAREIETRFARRRNMLPGAKS